MKKKYFVVKSKNTKIYWLEHTLLMQFQDSRQEDVIVIEIQCWY